MARGLYDDLLEHYLEEMKPHVLNLTDSEDQIRCDMWIRKICETPVMGIEDRKLRNMYAQLLLDVSKSAVVDGIFSENPPLGDLKPLPPYLTKRFDIVGILKVPDLEPPQLHSPYLVSDWLEERMIANTYLSSSSLRDLPLKPSSYPGLKSASNMSRKSFSTSAISLPLLSVKTTEDLIYLDLKNHYELTIKDQELKIASLENRVKALIKQSSVIRENKDKQVMELKVLATHSNRIAEDQFDKKFNDNLAKLEQEKLEFQQEHFKQIEELRKTSKSKITELESQIQETKSSMMDTITGLENKIREMNSEIQQLTDTQLQLEKDKEELQERTNEASLELLSCQRRFESLNQECKEAEKEHQMSLMNLRSKTDEQIDFVVKKQAGLVAHANDTIRDLQHQMTALKQTLTSCEQDNQVLKETHAAELKKWKENENNMKQTFNDRLDGITKDAEKKIQWLEISLRERQEEICKLQTIMKQQAMEAEVMLEDFKKKLENNSAQVYDDLQKQMETAVSDLLVSKMVRERQAQKFVHRLEEERSRHQQEISLLKEKGKAEKEFEKDQLIKINSEELKQLQENLEQNEKVIKEKALEIIQLKAEVVETKKLGEYQIKECQSLYMDERRKIKEQNATAISLLLQGMESKFKENIEVVFQKLNELEIKVASRNYQVQRLKERNVSLAEENQTRHLQQLLGVQEQHVRDMQILQEDLTREKQKTLQLENRIVKEAEDAEEKMKELLSEFEDRNRGLLPRITQIEFETTISALKSQITYLQYRIRLFEEDQERREKSYL